MVTVSGLTVDARPVELGGSGSWRDTAADDIVVSGTFADAALTSATPTTARTRRSSPTSVPDIVPALTTSAAAPSAAGATPRLVRRRRPLLLSSAGNVPFVPGGPPSASLVNLDNLLAQGWRGRGSAVLSAYVDTRDPSTLTRVTSGLAERHRRRGDHPRRRTGRGLRSVRGSLEPAAGPRSGHPLLLVAAAGIVVLASTSRRARSRDYAVLRLVGQRRSLGLLAQLDAAGHRGPAPRCGGRAGRACGRGHGAAVHLATADLPRGPVDGVDTCLLAGLVGLVVLTVVGIVTSRRIARRADPQRLRETV